MMAGIAHKGRPLLVVLTALSLVLSVMFAMADTPALASNHQIRICHALGNGGYTMPFPTKQQIFDPAGHGSFVDGVHPGDIVPPFDAGSQGSNSWDAYPGKNWDAEGQAIWNNDCVVPEPEPGRIIVKKVVHYGDPYQDFDFIATYDADGFSLSNGQSNDSGELNPGTYSVSETVPEGWTLAASYCDDENSTPESINLEAGETVTCTFENEEIPPEPGRIIVTKNVTPGSDPYQDFDFIATYDADGFSLSNGQSNDSGELNPGTYSVSETVPEGWTLVDASCDNGDDPSSIELEEGEEVECTFLNNETEVAALVIVTVSGSCGVENGVGFGEISVVMSVAGGATVTIRDEGGQIVDTVSTDTTIVVPEAATYSWQAVANAGFEFPSDFVPNGDVVIEECSEPGEIVVEKVTLDSDGEPLESSAQFAFETTGFTLADDTLLGGQSSSSGAITAGTGYGVAEQSVQGWTLVGATCDDGSDPDNIDLAPGEVVTCTFTNQVGADVLALVIVTIGGQCVLDGNDGVGVISVEMSIAGGANVEVRNANGDVVGAFTDDGTVEVPEGATYTWAASPNEGFEFATDFVPAGSITVATCSNPSVLPFTGANTGVLALIAAALGLLGGLVLMTTRKLEDL